MITSTAQALVGLSAIAFIVAVIGSIFEVAFLNVSAEAYSKACTNLAVLAIGSWLCFRDQPKEE